MKKLIVILILFQFVSKGFAQNASTRYDTCQVLSQYQGEWRYINGQDTIRIYLRHHRDFSPSFNSVSDKLYGWLEYKTGNTVIETTYPYKDMLLPYNYDSDSMTVNQRSIRLNLQQCNTTCSVLNGTIFDHLQSNEIHMVTAILNTNRTAILWKQTHSEWYGAISGATGMTLPKEFLLIKQ
jgi:hypothetical protein